MKKIEILGGKNKEKNKDGKGGVVIASNIKRVREFINRYGEVIRTVNK